MSGGFDEPVSFELDGGFDDATPIGLGTHESDPIERGDRQMYQVPVPADTELLVEVAFDGSVVDLDVYLYGRPSIDGIERASTAGSDAEPGIRTVSAPVREPTTCYVEVSGFAGGPASYSLSVSMSELPPTPPAEPRKELLNAPSLEPGTHEMEIAWDERQYYAIDAPEGVLSVALAFDKSTDLDLYLYDGPAFEDLIEQSAATKSEERISVESHRGRHYVEIYGYDIDGGLAKYTITINAESTAPAPARFEVVSLSVPPTGRVGETVTVSVTVKNTGGGVGSGYVRAGVDLDTDGTLEQVAEANIELRPNERHTVKRSFRIPSAVRSGMYRVGVWTDTEMETTTTRIDPRRTTES